METDSSQLIGQILGTCQIHDLLGQGGMGAVYRAQQSRPRREVAIKVLMPVFIHDSGSYADFLTRFRREADAIASLDHMHIMPIYEYGEQEHLAYLVMPYVTGGTLQELLEKRKTLPLYKVLSIAEQAASALDYAHAHNIVHRDLKPANILFHADGRVLLSDFGLAKMLKRTQGGPSSQPSTLSGQGTIIGTPDYLAPEQAAGESIDGRADVYSLGIILFEMLCGQVPFKGTTSLATVVKHATEEPPPVSYFNPTVSHAVEAVVMKAIAKQPERRYASAGDLAQALRLAMTMTGASSSSALPGSYDSHPDLPIVMTFTNNDTIPEVPAISIPDHQSSHIAREQQHSVSTIVLKPRRRLPPWVIALSTLLVVLLLFGGTGAYLYLRTTPHQPLPLAPTPIPLPAAVGKLLYSSNMPDCDAQSTLWSTNNNPRITCSAPTMELTNLSPHFLAGAFLDTLPDGAQFPTNYLLRVQVAQGVTSQNQFGIFFRNQPGPNHNGTYSFLLNPNEPTYWNAHSYNDKTGSATWLGGAQTTVPLQGVLTVDVLVNHNTFSFYINGHKQGTVSDNLYPTGTFGFAADVGADVFFKNLAIYALPNSA